MELRPPGTPIDDPFFAAVRRRHPDVDLVVLPPDAPEEEPAATVDDATVERAAEPWSRRPPTSCGPRSRR